MPHSFAYAQSSYEVPISADPQVLINGIDARSFGAELTALPDIALPGTRQQSIDLLDRNYAQYARDLYTGFNFDLTFQVVGKTPTDLNQKITDLLSFVANEQQRRNSSYIEPVIVEFPSLYLVSDEGTVSHMGTASISGSGTRFEDFGTAGDLIKFAGDSKKYHIKSISSNTSLVLYESPSGSASGAAYNLYRRRYLKARYSGSSSYSSSMSAPFLRDSLSTSRKPIVRDITISFYTDEPYWLGAYRNQDIAISNSTDYNFHLVNGVGDAGFHPRISIPTGQSLDSPKIYKIRHNFLGNFDGNPKYKDIANEMMDATSVAGNLETIEIRNESVVGNGSLYVSGGSASFESTRFKANPTTTRLEHTTINYKQGHFSTWGRVDFSSSGNDHYIIDFGSNNNSNLSVYYDGSAQNMVAKIGSATASVSVTLSNNSFYNVQVHWDTAFLTIYVREYGSNSPVTSYGAYPTPTIAYPNALVKVGNSYNGMEPFNGLIDEIVIWGQRLTSDEMDSLGTGVNPKTISPQHIKTHIGTTGDSGSTGIDYVSCDDDEIYPVTSITRNTVNNPDDFTVVIPELDTSHNFRESTLYPGATVYDEFSGEMGSFQVTGLSSSTPNTTLTLEPFDASTNMTHGSTASVKGNIPAPDEIGVHALMNGSASSNTSGGNWYGNNGSQEVAVPTLDRDDVCVAAWVKIDATQLSNMSANTQPSVGYTNNDKAYIFESFNNSLDEGWGLGIDDNGKTVIATHNLGTPSSFIQYTNNYSLTPAPIGSSPSTVLTYTNTSTTEWHRVEFVSFSVTQANPTSITVELSVYDAGQLVGSHSHQVYIGSGSYSHNLTLSTVPVLVQNESLEIKANIVDHNGSNTSIPINSTINYRSVEYTTKKVHEESSQPSISDGKWHHVAVLYEDNTDTSDTYYDPSSNLDGERLVRGKFHFYVDGIKYGTATDQERLSFGVLAENYPSVGFNPFNNSTFPGSIRDVRLYSFLNASTGGIEDDLFVNRLMCANGNRVIWTDTRHETHWWKFMDRPTATYITDKGYYAMSGGSPSNLYMKGANYSSDYSANGRTQNVLISKSFFSDPTLSVMPSIGAFRIYNHTDKYDSVTSTTHTTGWSMHEGIVDGKQPFVGENILKIPAKSNLLYPHAGLSVFIPKANTTAFGMTVSGYYYKTDAQSDPSHPIIQVDSIDNSGSGIDLSNPTTITTFIADNSDLDNWVYFEVPFSDDMSGKRVAAITFLQPFDTGTHYFCGIDIRANYANDSGFDSANANQLDHVKKIWNSDSDTSFTSSTSDFRTGARCLSVSLNDDSQGIVYEPTDAHVPNIYHNDFSSPKQHSSYYLSAHAKSSGTGNVIVSALGLNGAGSASGSVQYVGEIPVGNTSYTSMTEFLKLPPGGTSDFRKLRLTLKDSISFNLDGIVLRSRIDLPYTKTSTTISGGTPSYIFAERDLGVSLTNKSLIHYNNVIGMKSQGSGIIRIKPNVDTASPKVDNVIANSGGERYGSWNSTTGIYSSSSASSSLGLASIQSSNGVYQNVIGLKAGKSYTVKMDILTSTGATVTFGTHNIDVDTYLSNTGTVTSTTFTKTVSASNAWQTVLQSVSGTDANYLLKVEGSFYLDNVSVTETNQSAFDSVLFSWHEDDSGNPDNDNYLRLAYSSYTGFALQRNISGSLETIAVADVSYDSNSSLEVAFNWDESPQSDPFTGDKNYGTIVINGTKFGIGQSSLTSTSGVYKHLIVGCQGGYNSGITGSMHVDATVDGLLLSNRVMPVEEMIETYKAQEKLKSSNDIISLPDMSTATDYFVYNNGQSYSSKNSTQHLESIKKNQTSNVNAKNYGLNDNDKAVLYSKFGSNPSSGFNIQLDYEPRYR